MKRPNISQLVVDLLDFKSYIKSNKSTTSYDILDFKSYIKNL